MNFPFIEYSLGRVVAQLPKKGMSLSIHPTNQLYDYYYDDGGLHFSINLRSVIYLVSCFYCNKYIQLRLTLWCGWLTFNQLRQNDKSKVQANWELNHQSYQKQFLSFSTLFGLKALTKNIFVLFSQKWASCWTPYSKSTYLYRTCAIYTWFCLQNLKSSLP